MQRLLFAAAAALLLATAPLFSQEDLSLSRAMEQKGLLQGLAASPSGTQEEKMTVAVLDFLNVDGSQSVLGRYFAEQTGHYLAKRPKIILVERTQIDRLVEELDFSASGYVSDSSAIELGGMLGASAVVLGTLIRVGRKIEVHMKTIDTRTGAVLTSGSTELSGGKYLTMYNQLLHP
jgi:TolB-like protein